jgi:hypothetical protein
MSAAETRRGVATDRRPDVLELELVGIARIQPDLLVVE